MDNPAITAIVIPVYNRPKSVLRALDSVAAQSLPPQRLVVVDDGSTDGTAQRVGVWLERHLAGCEKRLLRCQRNGAAAARNRGMAELGHCDFINFLDSDDVLAPDFLQRTAAVLSDDPAAVAVSTARLTFGPGETRQESLHGLQRDPLSWFFRNGAGVASCSLLRAGIVLQLGGFPASIPSGHDLALFARMIRHGRWRVIDGAPTTFHRPGASAGGEEGNLSETCAHRMVHWARTREEILREEVRRGLGRRRHGLLLGVIQSLWLGAALEAHERRDRTAALGHCLRSLGCLARQFGWRVLPRTRFPLRTTLAGLAALARLALPSRKEPSTSEGPRA